MATFKYTTKMQQDQLTNARTSLGTTTVPNALRDGFDTGRFYIMGGAVPTQGELDAFTSSSFRQADILTTSIVKLSTAPFDITNMLIKLNLSQPVASASGTATWFQWKGSTAGTASTFIGTITALGGGGEMTLNNQNIVSGQTYNVGPMTFDFSKREYQY